MHRCVLHNRWLITGLTGWSGEVMTCLMFRFSINQSLQWGIQELHRNNRKEVKNIERNGSFELQCCCIDIWVGICVTRFTISGSHSIGGWKPEHHRGDEFEFTLIFGGGGGSGRGQIRVDVFPVIDAWPVSFQLEIAIFADTAAMNWPVEWLWRRNFRECSNITFHSHFKFLCRWRVSARAFHSSATQHKLSWLAISWGDWKKVSMQFSREYVTSLFV